MHIGHFIVLAYAISWVTILPFVLASRGMIEPSPLVMLGAAISSCGPTLAAIAIVLATRQGMRSLLGERTQVHGRLGWALAGLFLPMALHVCSAAVLVLFGAPAGILRPSFPFAPEHYAIFVVAPLGEELGWRGFLQRRLQTATAPIRAALIVGLLWAFWHLPMMVAEPSDLGSKVAAIGYVTAAAIPFAYLFNKSGGSVLVAVVAHMGLHLDNVNRMGGSPLYATTAAMVLLAAVIAWRSPRLGLQAQEP